MHFLSTIWPLSLGSCYIWSWLKQEITALALYLYLLVYCLLCAEVCCYNLLQMALFCCSRFRWIFFSCPEHSKMVNATKGLLFIFWLAPDTTENPSLCFLIPPLGLVYWYLIPRLSPHSDVPMAQLIVNLNASMPPSEKFIVHMPVHPRVAEMIRSKISEFRDQNSYEKPQWMKGHSASQSTVFRDGIPCAHLSGTTAVYAGWLDDIAMSVSLVMI